MTSSTDHSLGSEESPLETDDTLDVGMLVSGLVVEVAFWNSGREEDPVPNCAEVGVTLLRAGWIGARGVANSGDAADTAGI